MLDVASSSLGVSKILGIHELDPTIGPVTGWWEAVAGDRECQTMPWRQYSGVPEYWRWARRSQAQQTLRNSTAHSGNPHGEGLSCVTDLPHYIRWKLR